MILSRGVLRSSELSEFELDFLRSECDDFESPLRSFLIDPIGLIRPFGDFGVFGVDGFPLKIIYFP